MSVRLARDADFAALRTPLPQDVARLVGAGRLEEAARACRARLAGDVSGRASVPSPELAARLRVEELRLGRLPAQYPVTRAEALATLREECPDARMADLDRLERAGRIDWRMVGGEARYLASWLRTLRLCAGELPGLTPAPGEGADRDAVIAEMRERGLAERDITLRASLGVPCAPGGSPVRAWLPVAAACPQHAAAEVLAATDGAVYARADAPQRTAFWESRGPCAFGLTYRCHVRAPYVDLWSEEGVERARHADLAPSGVPAPKPCEADLAPVEPHVVFTPLVLGTAARLAREAIGRVPGRSPVALAPSAPRASAQPVPLARPASSAPLAPREQLECARAVYDLLTREVDYRFQPAYAQLGCIVDAVLADRRADCGMFAFAFISLCRALGIPARWQSGLEVSLARTGPHDWVMFHVDGIGWLWADCCFGSSARQDGSEARRRHYFGNVDPCRVAFNREFYAPFEPAGEGVRWDPFDNQLGEASVEGRGLDAPEMRRTVELVCFE